MFGSLSNQSLFAFALASLLLAAAPGLGVTFLVTRALSEGRTAGLAATLGVAFGNFGNALGASLGLATILALNPALFSGVKWIGAGYLVALGIGQILHKDQKKTTRSQNVSHSHHFRDGFWVALLNPKTMLFFAAFLPQFLQTQSASLQQILPLGGLFVAIALISDSIYVILAGRIATQFRHAMPARAGTYLTAMVYIGLGIFTGLAGLGQ